MTPVPETITFPSLVPSARSYVEGQHPINRAQTMAGTSVRRLLSAQATEPELRLKFQNIPDASAEDILSTYDEAYGTRKQITLPSALTAGLSTSLATLIRNEAGPLRWYFSGRPSLESTVPGRSTVSVILRARLVPTFTPPEIGSTTITPPSGTNVVNGYACLAPAALWTANNGATITQAGSNGALQTAALISGTGNARTVVYGLPVLASTYNNLTVTFTATISGTADAIGFGILNFDTTTPNYVGSPAGWAGIGISGSTESPHFISINFFGYFSSVSTTQGIYIKNQGEPVYSWSGGSNFVVDTIVGTHTWKITYSGTNRTNMTARVYKNNTLRLTATGITLPAKGRYIFGGGSGYYGASATISNISITS